MKGRFEMKGRFYQIKRILQMTKINDVLTLSQTTNFRLFQTERVCR